MKSKLYKNDQGVGILQALGLATLIGGLAFLAARIGLQSSKDQTTASTRQAINDASVNLISSGRNLFLDTVSSTGLRTEGMCSLVQVESTETNVTNIFVTLPNYGEAPLFDDAHVLKVFSGLKIVQMSECNDLIYNGTSAPAAYNWCLRVDTEASGDVGVQGSLIDLNRKYDPVFHVAVRPIYSNPIQTANGQAPFQSFTPNEGSSTPIQYLLKAMGFGVELKVNYRPVRPGGAQDAQGNPVEVQRKSASLSGFVWGPEAGSCDLNGKVLALNGAGSGDTSGNIIHDNPGFTDDSTISGGLPDPLEVVQNFDQVQSGELVGDSGTTITSNLSDSVYASCNERQFRCRQSSAADENRVYDAMVLSMQLKLRQANKLGVGRTHISIAPELIMRKSSVPLVMVPLDFTAASGQFINPDQKAYETIVRDGGGGSANTYEKYSDESFYRVFYDAQTMQQALQAAGISQGELTNQISSIMNLIAERGDPVLTLAGSPNDVRVVVIPTIAAANSQNTDTININGSQIQTSFAKRDRMNLDLRVLSSADFNMFMTLQDEFASDSSPTANKLCRKICTSANQYNQGVEKIFPVFKYKVNQQVTIDANGDPLQLDYEVEQSPVYCTACYMKSCQRFGLGTFGKMSQMPNEPLDSGVPECVQHEINTSENSEIANASLGSTNSNRCIALKLRPGDQAGFEYLARDCNQEKNILCFNFGKHLLAADALPGGLSLVSSNFHAARNICFNTSKETFVTDSLISRFDQQGFFIGQQGATFPDEDTQALAQSATEFLGIGEDIGQDSILARIPLIRSGSETSRERSTLGPVRRLTPRTSSDPNLQTAIPNSEIGFFNLATQGSFLAPVGNNQESALRDHNETRSQITGQEFWTGLRTDNTGFIYAPAPEISDSAMKEENSWALYYDDQGTMVARNFNAPLGLQTGESPEQVGLLYHDARYKGVVYVNTTNPVANENDEAQVSNESAKTNGFRFLCKNTQSGNFLVTTGRSKNVSDAAQKCEEAGALFLPPITTLQWIKAMHLVHANDPSAAFPIFEIKASTDYDPVWVAVAKNGISNSKVYKGSNLGDFLSGGATKSINGKGKYIANPNSYDYSICVGINQTQVRVDRRTCPSTHRTLTAAEAQALGDDNNIVLRTLLFQALKRANYSESKKIKVYQ